MTPRSQIRKDAVLDPVGTARRIMELEQQLAEADAALWRCVELSGDDTSLGPPRRGTGDWPQLPELAVREIERLRREYDEDMEAWRMAEGC